MLVKFGRFFLALLLLTLRILLGVLILLFSLVLSIFVYIVGEITEPPERTVRYVMYGEETRRERDVN